MGAGTTIATASGMGDLGLRRLLVPVDGSPCSFGAVRFASDLAARAGASVELLYVYEPPAGSFMELMRIERATLESAVARTADRIFEEARRAVARDDVPVSSRARIGHPLEEILATANEGSADMIVIGAHGRSRLGSLLLGSLSTQVLHHADRPVTVVPAQDEGG